MGSPRFCQARPSQPRLVLGPNIRRLLWILLWTILSQIGIQILLGLSFDFPRFEMFHIIPRRSGFFIILGN